MSHLVCRRRSVELERSVSHAVETKALHSTIEELESRLLEVIDITCLNSKTDFLPFIRPHSMRELKMLHRIVSL